MLPISMQPLIDTVLVHSSSMLTSTLIAVTVLNPLPVTSSLSVNKSTLVSPLPTSQAVSHSPSWIVLSPIQMVLIFLTTSLKTSAQMFTHELISVEKICKRILFSYITKVNSIFSSIMRFSVENLYMSKT